MSSSDWDRELKKIDRQLASIPDAALVPQKPGAGAPAGAPAAAPAGAPAAAPARAPGLSAAQALPAAKATTGTTTFGVYARLTLALVLGVAITYWPYSSRCGVGLVAYLGAVGTLITAGVWSSIWTWRHRAAKGHTLALLLVLWGLVLAGIDVLPRVGWAIPKPDHPATWGCG